MAEEQHNDEETERLLAEMEKREQLEKEAKALGVEFRSNISTEKLEQRVTEAKQPEAETPTTEEAKQPEAETPTTEEAKQPEAFTVVNVSKNPRRVGGNVVAVGESYTLTDMDLENERLIAKVERAVELGLLETDEG